MKLQNIQCKDHQKLSKLITDKLGFSYSKAQKIIRNKDVKINGHRTSKDVDIFDGDLVQVYFNQVDIKIVYQDDDIVVAVKPRCVETINDLGDDLKTRLQEQIGMEVFAVHRLDRNTEGLVIFAKNLMAKQSLDEAIKLRKLKKFYIAKVVGVPKEKEARLVAYLKKDSKKSLVYVSDVPQPGYDEIQTRYELISHDDEFSVLNVELVTGKTHQIRAHLSHVGYPILGDDKYGNSYINKNQGKKYQCLCAYKLIFCFDQNDYLSRLNGLVVQLQKEEVSFL